MLKKIVLTLLFLLIAVSLGTGSLLYWTIVVEPGEEIKADNIRKILGKESTVYYSDGTSKLGVFFDTAHRQYVNYQEIPEEFVKALVASEDDRFFDHFGFDIVGITRAMLKNIEAGRVVQGGSTLTQQTAKNLFKRTERSYKAKLKELIFALRLEYYYPKEKIFEFYANQFYVSGNGHGLGVAARYYFDKKPEELNLLECAFIAGSVKRPNYYNPFRKKSDERMQVAKSRAKVRIKYVLGKMRQLGMIDSISYNGALASELEFKNGKVGYTLDHAMELVRDAVSSNDVELALQKQGISNIATSGIRIITTIDHGLQEKSLTALRGELSRLDVRLRGYERDEVQAELAALNYGGDSAKKKGAFLFGTISSIEGNGQDTKIIIELDKKLGKGVIEAAGLQKLVTAQVKFLKNRWSDSGKKDLEQFVSQLQRGDRVWVSVRELRDEPDLTLLELEKYPLLQGAGIVVQKGKILALAGGSENRFFNRAVHAKRTMGSAFKPLVYAAAIQLGWNSADLLKNERDVFIYHDQPYFPRPDHKSPHKSVSMSWAGVHSENVASVWLLESLCDQLTPIQFREVAEKVGLAPKVVDGEKEPYRSYKTTIRDKHGIQVNRAVIREAAFNLAVKNLETDFIFDNMVDEYRYIEGLHYGLNFDKYQQSLDDELAKEEVPVKESILKEYELRSSILATNYLQLEKLRSELNVFRQTVAFVNERDPFQLARRIQSDSYEKETDRGELYVNNNTREFYFLSNKSLITGVVPISVGELRRYLDSLSGQEVATFWREINLSGDIEVSLFDQLQEQLEVEYQKLIQSLPYQFEVLENVRDFRITVGLFYLLKLSKDLGIDSKLEPVLSFPLGSNVVSLLEATKMYEGLVTGKATHLEYQGDGIDSFGIEGEANGDVFAILDRIESEDGEVLYQPISVQKRVIDKKTSLIVGSMLENVVKFGTGRYANKHVKFTGSDGEKVSEVEELSLSVPLLGKTGTANKYTNASFLGYVPEVSDSGVAMNLDSGYAVGVYVGFDDNTQMRRKASRVSGAVGALPTWSKIANFIQEERHYASRLDPVDLSFYGLGIKHEELGQYNFGVDPDSGGIVRQPVTLVPESSRMQPAILTFGTVEGKGQLKLTRFYEPVWKVKNKMNN